MKKMSEKIIISVVASAVHTQYWMELYNSLAKANTVPFELIFVGNKQPDFELPENFSFIYSEVKPAQCWEIGSRRAIGEYIMPVSDDLIFSEGTLNDLYRYQTEEIGKVVVSCRYKLRGGRVRDDLMFFNINNPDSPPALMCPLVNRKIWESLGGIDRRFIALYWDLDLHMRMFELGRKAFFSPMSIAEERVNEGSRLSGRYAAPDRALLDSFWVTESGCSNIRLAPVEHFDNKDIMFVSQGNKGEWK